MVRRRRAPGGVERHTVPMPDSDGRGVRNRAFRVHGLFLLPDGPAFPLARFATDQDGDPLRYITLGALPTAHIVLDHETVSSRHCLIERDDSDVKVHDCDSTNGTIVNGVPVGVTQLYPGNVLTLGAQSLVAYGPQGYRGPKPLVVRSLYSFVHAANEAYASMTAAATAIGMAPRTFIRWVTVRYRSRPRLGSKSKTTRTEEPDERT